MTQPTENTTDDPLRQLAQAILDGRVYMSTEWWKDRDGENHATTTIKVEVR